MDTALQFTGFEFERATKQDLGYNFNDKKPLPCETCPFAAQCEANFTECSAFRNWSHAGDYKDSDVGRFIRAAK